MRTTSDPSHKGWGSFASNVGPGHHNPCRAASRGRVARLWGNRENVVDSHVVCLLVRLYASTPLVVAAEIFLEDLSRTSVVGTPDENRVLGRTCPHLVERRNRVEVAVRVRQMLCGRGQDVPDGVEATVCRRRVSRSQASQAS